MSQSNYNTAIDLYQKGMLDQAASTLQQGLQSNPKHAESLHLLGIIHYQHQQTQLAVEYIRQALTVAPRNVDFLNNYGLVLKANAQLDEALKAYQQALLLNPKDLDVQLNIANVMMTLTRFEEAAGYYRRLLRVYKPYQPEHETIRQALSHALSQLGNQASTSGNHVQAEASFAEAIQFNDQESHYFYNLANAERELGKPTLAAKHFLKATQLNPNDADAFNNLGNVQRELGLLDAAITSYAHALTLNPNLHHAQVHLVHQKQHICDWVGLTDAIKSVRQLVNNVQEAQVSPFAFLAMPNTTAAEQLICANHWVENRFKPLKALGNDLKFDVNLTKKSTLRIGYLSADFRLHPLAFLISDLIECHDRTHFEIIAYAFGANDQSKARARLEKAFDQFHDIGQLSELDAAKKMHADGIDILVDLTGFTQTSRSGIMALRPAAIHISWLGFAGTMGYLDTASKTPLFDYLLTDAIICPPAQANHYAEQLAYLPCYQPNDRQRPIGQAPSRADCQLPENAFVFCSFNQSFKITPDIFSTWMDILNAVPNSILWLLDCNDTAKQHLITAAAEQGIAQARLIFAQRLAIQDHLARHVHAGLFLDTPTYNAHTTCSDALWMDVPVLTLEGQTFSSRVASSLVQSVGLPEMVVETIDAYKNAAIYYASNTIELTAIKQRLSANKLSSPLFDTPAFTRSLETLYQTMWDHAIT